MRTQRPITAIFSDRVREVDQLHPLTYYRINFRAAKIEFLCEFRDIWVGIYWNIRKPDLIGYQIDFYISVIPMFLIVHTSADVFAKNNDFPAKLFSLLLCLHCVIWFCLVYSPISFLIPHLFLNHG